MPWEFACRPCHRPKPPTPLRSSSSSASPTNTSTRSIFPTSPPIGTLTGYHQYDNQLESYSRQRIDRWIADLAFFEKRVEAISSDGLDQTTRGDRDLVLSNIRSTLLMLETIRPWEKNPDMYSGGISNGAFSLMERKFAPPDERLRSLIAREKLMPSRLDQARANLKNPPHISTEIAIEQLPGIISFFENDVPYAFADARDPALNAEFKQTNAAVIASLKSYLDWLKSDLLPKSNGDFRIGADTFAKKLQYDEMVDIPLEKLLEIGRADLHKNQQHFNAVAEGDRARQGSARGSRRAGLRPPRARPVA